MSMPVSPFVSTPHPYIFVDELIVRNTTVWAARSRLALVQCVSTNCAHDIHYAVLAHAGPATLHPVGPRRLVFNIPVGHWDHDTSDVAGSPPLWSALLPLAARTVRRACVAVRRCVAVYHGNTQIRRYTRFSNGPSPLHIHRILQVHACKLSPIAPDQRNDYHAPLVRLAHFQFISHFHFHYPPRSPTLQMAHQDSGHQGAILLPISSRAVCVHAAEG